MQQHDPHDPHVRQAAFTLIELLVVVSIIALLIALLLPSLKGARDAARTTGCLSNHRQIGVAFNMYASTFNDYIPPATVGWQDVNPNPSLDYGSWTSRLGRSGMLGSPVTYTGYNVSYATTLRSWPVLRCPGEPSTYNPGSADPSTSLYLGTGAIAGINYNRWTFYYAQSSYATNLDITIWAKGSDPATAHWGEPRKGWSIGPALMKPAESSVVADGLAYNLFYFDDIDFLPGHWSYARTMYAFHHMGDKSTNVMFWDGHAATRQHYQYTGVRVWSRVFNGHW